MTSDPERHRSITEALSASRLDAFATLSPSTVLLLTGYWPVVGNSLAIATRSGETVLLVPEDELDLAQATISAPTRLEHYQPGFLDRLTTPTAELRAPLTALLTSLNLTSATIGIELHQTLQPATYVSSAHFRHDLADLLNNAAPRASLVAADTTLAELQATKSPRELTRLKLACRIAQAAFTDAQSHIQPGRTEPQIASAFQSAFDTALLAHSAQRSYGAFFCMSGPNSASASAAYARTRHRTVQPGDLVMIHANTCADGFWTDITRTYTAGEPTPRHKEISAAITEAGHAALAAIHPGVPAAQVDRAARDIMHARGFGQAFRHGTGHGVGFAAISGNALPRIHPASPDILQTGMTFNVEPSAYFDGYGGMRHCDVIAVTSTGSENLTDF